jgi:glycosyltransferase involved in cell wall biosynthesis|tara:strand:- start:90743 stop:91819 length:1077 start_codon:yes stop_codon:yes gene_type:complete
MNFNFICPINQLGYGVASGNIVKALGELGNSIALWPLGKPDWPNQEDHELFTTCMHLTDLPDFNAPCIRIWHQNDMSQFVGRGPKIGFPIFEMDRFTEVEVHHLSSLDKIFVCSKWAKKIVEENVNISPENVHVIPLGVNPDIFSSTGIAGRKETVFFNCGKWEIRKGHDIISEAFDRAFEPDDNVELWMMCANPFYSPQENYDWERQYKTCKMGSKVRMIPKQRDQHSVSDIMKTADCGVFPAKAEGWNLELLEMMSCGKHVIATNYSGHTEFCNSENCMLIECDELEDAHDGKWFNGQGQWAKIDEKQIDMIAAYMRDIHALKQSGLLEKNIAGIETAQKFSWENSAQAILDINYG